MAEAILIFTYLKSNGICGVNRGTSLSFIWLMDYLRVYVKIFTQIMWLIQSSAGHIY